MNQELFNGILLALLGLGGSAMGWGFKSHLRMGKDIIFIKTFLMLTNKSFALTLHSPHTPYYDSLLVKFCGNHGLLSEREWDDIERITSQVEGDLKRDRSTRAIAYNTLVLIRHLQGKPLPRAKSKVEETTT